MLYDRLIREGGHPAVREIDRRMLQEATVIFADNIAQMLWLKTDELKINVLTAFPNVAPPWETFFIEWGSDRQYFESNFPDDMEHHYALRPRLQQMDHLQGGLLLHAVLADRVHLGDCPMAFTELSEQVQQKIGTKIGWYAYASLFVSMTIAGQTKTGNSVFAMFPITEDGHFVECDGGWLAHIEARDRPHDVAQRIRVDGTKYSNNDEFFVGMAEPAFVTIAFLHCKNVSIKKIDPSRQVRRQCERSGTKAPCSYHILEVDGVRRILEEEGGLSMNGHRKALHICRGHFADYRQRGAFGKHKGMFWRPMHLRGTPNEGIVGKDYRIVPKS